MKNSRCHEERVLTAKDMPRVQKSFFLAKKVGKKLEWSEILFKTMQRQQKKEIK
tara:strand:+ start:694 stop:855 length:162 start_codon:yes stop_codon:yes gene_type:complete